jgi:antitoxin HicB
MPSILETPTAAVAKQALDPNAAEKQLRHFMGLSYPIELIEEDGQYTATHPDLPGCASFGDTPDEAVAELRVVRELWLRGEIESGNAIPQPSSYEETFSGKFVLRMPKTLHRTLHHEAKLQGVSLNQYVIFTLADRHSKKPPVIDYQKISTEILAGLQEFASLKLQYGAHRRRPFYKVSIDGPTNDFQHLQDLVRPKSFIRCNTDSLTSTRKRDYLEAHVE